MKITILAMMVISSLSFAQTTPELCQIAYNGEVTGQMISKTQGDGFYNKAHELAMSRRTCVKAEMAWSGQGVRVYAADGSRIGGKSGSQGSGLSQSASYNCITMTCLPVVDSRAQTGAGYGTGGLVQPGSTVVNTGSAPVVVNGSAE